MILTNAERWSARVEAARALAEIRDTRAVDPLVQTLKAFAQMGYEFEQWDCAFDIAVEMGKALGALGEPAVEPLIQVLKEVKYPAAYALWMIGDARAAEPLIQASRGRTTADVRYPWSTRLEQVLGKANRRDPGAIPALVDLLFENPIPVGWLILSDEEIGKPEFFIGELYDQEPIRQALSHQGWIRKGMEAGLQIRKALQFFPSCTLKGETLELLIQASGFESRVYYSDSYHTVTTPVHHINIAYSTEKSAAAVEKLCSMVSPLASNILLKVLKEKKDIRIKSGNCNRFEQEVVSFLGERRMAQEELASSLSGRSLPEAGYSMIEYDS